MRPSLRALPLLFGSCLVVACVGELGSSLPSPPEGSLTDDDTAADVDAYVYGLPKLELPEQQPKQQVDCDGACPPAEQDGNFHCSYTRYVQTAHYDRFVALQPNSATLWPGNVVRGADARNGILTPIGVELAPVTFSVSLENLGGSPVGTMDEPSLSSFRDARNAILAAGVTGATPAVLDFEVRSVSNESQLAVALGASASWPGGADIAASFDFNSSSQKTKVLVNFTQAYYTIDVDTPATPSEFFAAGTTVEDLEPWMNASSPPVYVQSVTYGRRVIFSVQSNATSKAIKAALEAAYDGVAVKASGKVSVEHEQVLRDSTIRAFVLGGAGDDAVAVIDGFESLADFIKKGGSYSSASPGAPVAYKLAYLDNAVTTLAFTTDYAERTCVQTMTDLHVALDRLDHLGGGDLGDQLELFGQVTVRYPTKSSPVTSCTSGGAVATLWKVPSGSWVNVKENGSLTVNGAFVELHGLPVSAGSRICLTASFGEEDWSTGEGSGADDYGTTRRLIAFADGWGGEHTLVTYGSGDNSIGATLSVALPPAP